MRTNVRPYIRACHWARVGARGGGGGGGCEISLIANIVTQNPICANERDVQDALPSRLIRPRSDITQYKGLGAIK